MQTARWRLGGYAAFVLGVLMVMFGSALGAPIVFIAITTALTLSVALVDIIAQHLYDRLAYIALLCAALHAGPTIHDDPLVSTSGAFALMTVCAFLAASFAVTAWVKDGFRLHPFDADPTPRVS